MGRHFEQRSLTRPGKVFRISLPKILHISQGTGVLFHFFPKRHLAEFWMIEPEIGWADLWDVMKCAEDYLKFCIQYISSYILLDKLELRRGSIFPCDICREIKLCRLGAKIRNDVFFNSRHWETGFNGTSVNMCRTNKISYADGFSWWMDFCGGCY